MDNNKKLRSKSRLEHHKNIFERKKGELIQLKTNLPNVPISNKLLNFKSQSINEILNQPMKEKKKFGLKLFNKGVKKGYLNNTIISSDMNKPMLNLDIFNTLEVLEQPNFKISINKTMIQDNNNNNKAYTFKLLLKENYSRYIATLKKIYPAFKFNHYKKFTKEYSEYIKKYGEEGDINNRHYNSTNEEELISFRFKNPKKDEKEYHKSNLLEILGAQKNIECDPKDFKIKDDFLSRSSISELKMIQKDLQFKTGVIDKELDFILMHYPQKLYNYIENNKYLKENIKEFQKMLIQRRMQKKKVIYNYLTNSSKLILKEQKKKKDIKVYLLLKEIEKIYTSMKELRIVALSQSENKIKEVNDAINKVKDHMKNFNSTYNKDKKYKFIIEIEQIVQQYENQGEENLNDQFNFNIKKLINNCLIYYDKGSEAQNGSEENEKNEKIEYKWDLSKENDIKNKIIFIENDFHLTEKEDKIYLNFLLIYNNIKNTNNNILKLLLSILDMFEIIIKDNLDINTIVSVFQDVFLKLINKNFEIIQNITKNKLTMIKIAANCFSIILSNYFYIIMLIQNNFGFRIKIFGEVTELINKEMDKNILELINDYYEDILSVNRWKYFIYENKRIKENIETYFKSRNINLFKLIIDKYENYIDNFKLERKKEFDKAIRENLLDWDQYKNIDSKYQKMFDIFYSCQDIFNLKFDQIDILKNINMNNEIIINDKSDFLIIKNNKESDGNTNINHKVSIFSLEIINYLYDYLLVLVELIESINYNNDISGDNPDKEKDNQFIIDLKDNMYKEIKEKLINSRELTINNKSGMLNNKRITEKETCIYYSDIIIIENILQIFLLKYPDEELSTILNEIKIKCIDLIMQLMHDTINKIFEDFNNLDFSNYPIVGSGKGYNKYVNYFTVIKRIYDNMCNCFSKSQINEIIKDDLTNLFNKINQTIDKKGIIENDEQLKQIRNEFNYIKKVFKLFPDIDTNNLKELIDGFIIKVNPNKLPVNKKKKGNQNKVKDKEEKKENEENKENEKSDEKGENKEKDENNEK